MLAVKDMAGLFAPAGNSKVVSALRSRFRPARSPAHPRHTGWPARQLCGRLARRGRCRRRRRRAAGRSDQPARAEGSIVAATALSTTPACRFRRCADLEPYWEALQCSCAVRVWSCRGRQGGLITTRFGRPTVQSRQQQLLLVWEIDSKRSKKNSANRPSVRQAG